MHNICDLVELYVHKLQLWSNLVDNVRDQTELHCEGVLSEIPTTLSLRNDSVLCFKSHDEIWSRRT